MKESSLDKHRTLLGGFVSALKNSDHFYFLSNLFGEMDQFAAATLSKKSYPGLYLKERYDSDMMSDIFTKISATYRDGFAPISTSVKESFIASVQSIFGESGCSQNILDFCERIEDFIDTEGDFERAKEMLRIDCLDIVMRYTPSEEKIKKSDPRSALASRDTRYRKISAMFDSGGISLVSSDSDEMTAYIDKTQSLGRIKSYSGTDLLSFDSQTGGGLPAVGLSIFLAGTSDGKTALMSALAANHCVKYLDDVMSGKEVKPPKIWGYIGEDSIDTYTRRILVNIINRRGRELGLPELTTREFLYNFTNDSVFRESVTELRKLVMSGLQWVKPPSNSGGIFDFSLNKLLKSFENWFVQFGKPDFILLDYVQLLRLDKSAGLSGKRIEELNTIAEVLNTWAAAQDVAVITGAQATADGMKKARDLSFHEIEDIAEAKGMSRPAHMLVSIIRVPELSDSGEYLGQKQAFKVLKNRNGEKEQIFIGDLDFAKCISFSNLKLIEPKDWQGIVTRIRNIRSQDQVKDQKKPSGFGRPRQQEQRPQEQKPGGKPVIPPPDEGEL